MQSKALERSVNTAPTKKFLSKFSLHSTIIFASTCWVLYDFLYAAKKDAFLEAFLFQKSERKRNAIKRDTKKLKEVENDPSYSDGQRQLYKDRLDDSNTEKQARLEISQNRKDLLTQVTRIKQATLEVLDKNISLAERIRTLFRKQRMPISSILIALSVTISKTVLAITGFFGAWGGGGGSLTKDEGVLNRWLKRCTQKTC